MTITIGQPADIPEIMSLIHAAVKRMIAGGLYQWDEHYPNIDIITDDVKAHHLFKILEKDQIAGVMVLNEQYPPEYDDLVWEDKEGKFIIVHRLCIHPDYQGQGYSKKLMRFAGEHAKKNGCSSIRLDTNTSNRRALALYDSLNYRRVGTVTFRMGLFQVFEKGLKQGEESRAQGVGTGKL
jgi:ribosomal protein S18 acetylase RimI-like enzyme